MPKFRKRPVEIEAMQWTDDDWVAVANWMRGEFGIYTDDDGNRCLHMKTVHGETAIARPGDWVVPEPEYGRYYPVKPDIFAATYEPVPDAEATD